MRIRALFLAIAAAISLGACNYQSLPGTSVSSQDAKWLALAPHAETEIRDKPWIVRDPTGQSPGTIVVDTKRNYLYFVLPHKKAIRYGVATGDEAYGWTGTAYVEKMKKWPRWIPPKDMVERWPYLKPTYDAGGLPGGPDNPLGARALYLYQNGRDTLYRIHGTNEPEKIGQSVSSGCIRMRNIDAIDLYRRVHIGTKVIVE